MNHYQLILLYKLWKKKALQKVNILICSSILYNVVGGSDYDLEGPYSVTIPAKQTMISFVIKIINDSVLEENESFTLIINAGSLPNDVGLGNPNITTIKIVDDDSKS